MKGAVLFRIGLIGCVFLFLTPRQHVISDNVEQTQTEAKNLATLIDLLEKYNEEDPATYKSEKQNSAAEVNTEDNDDDVVSSSEDGDATRTIADNINIEDNDIVDSDIEDDDDTRTIDDDDGVVSDSEDDDDAQTVTHNINIERAMKDEPAPSTHEHVLRAVKESTSKIRIDKGIKETLFNVFSDVKTAYKKLPVVPQTPIDVIRAGIMVTEFANTMDEDSTFGVFTGSVTCLNIFCSPMSLISYTLMGLWYIEDMIVGTKEGVETFNDQVLKRTTSLPMVGSATTVTSRMLDTTVEPVLDALMEATNKVFKPVEFAYNISVKITNMCTDIKGGILTTNMIALLQDLKNGNKNFTNQLGLLNELFKDECGTILGKLPTLGNIAKELLKVGVDIWPDIANFANKGAAAISNAVGEVGEGFSSMSYGGGQSYAKKESVEKRGFESLPLYKNPMILVEHDPMYMFIKPIYFDGIKKAKAALKLFEPVSKFFQTIKRAIDSVLDFEICIPLGPFGKLLEVGLKVAAAVAEGVVEFGNKLFQGDLVGAVGALGSTFKEIGNIIGKELLKDVGKAVINILGKDALNALEDVGDAIVSVIMNPGNAVEAVGNAVSNGVKSAAKKLKKLFGKRSLKSGEEYEAQSPNPVYLTRYLNESLMERDSVYLNRRSRGFSASDLEKLADFMKGAEVCVTPRKVLNGLAFLVDTILKPIEKVVSEGLKPVLNLLEKMIMSIFPNLEFLNKINGVSIDMVGPDDLTNLFSVITKDPTYQHLKESADQFSPSCMKYVRGHVKTDPEYSYKDVLCNCVSGAAGCAKREVEEDMSASECRYAGVAYQGTKSTTVTGKTCMRWDSQSPHSHLTTPSQLPEMSLKFAENYCRDRAGGFKQPWCYTTNKNKRWEYCDVPLCGPACISSGRETSGKVSVSGTGRKCQNWKIQSPNMHPHTDASFPEGDAGQAENFCHNPDNKATGPYCYTTDVGQPWDVCDVAMCDSYSALRSKYKEYIHTRCPGNDIKTISNTNIKQCFETCHSMSNCVAFKYYNKKCWIKKKCLDDEFKFTANHYLYVKSEYPGYRLYRNKRCVNNDIEAKNVTNNKECAEMCDSIPRCVAFVKTGIKCNLKEYCAPDKLTSKSGTHAFLKDEIITYNTSAKLSCSGNDITKKTGITNAECAQICARIPACVAYSRLGSTCWFKSKCDTVVKRTSTINFKEVGRFSKYSDRDCPGNGIVKKTGIYSPQQCMHICKSVWNCAAFTLKLTTGECYLKKRCYHNQLIIKVNYDTYLMDQAPNFKLYKYKDCPGNNLLSEMNVQNQVECATKCDNDPFCRGFRSRNTKCLLKTKCEHTALKSNSNQDVYIKKNIKMFDKYSWKGCAGNNLKSLNSETLENCATACYKNTMCVAFKYNIQTATTGRCYIKFKCNTSKLVDRNDGHLFIQKPITRYGRAMNKDCAGNVLKTSYIVAFPENCASDCYKRADCFGFVYRTTDSRCWLKARCRPTEFISRTNLIAHYQKELLGFKMYEKKNCPSNLVESSETDGVVQCAALCHKVPRCVAVVIHRSTFKCYLKYSCDEKKFVYTGYYDTYMLQANRPHTINAARGKFTYQKNTDSDGFSWYAVDGNLGSNHRDDGCTHTDKTRDPWWYVDLGTTRTIYYISIVNRGDCCGDRLRDFDVYGSSTSNHNDGQLCVHQPGRIVDGVTLELSCETPVTARYVIIRMSGKDRTLTLCEVGVFVERTGIDLVDIARGKTTRQSSTYQDDSSGRAVDGKKLFKLGDNSCTHTNTQSDPWWSVDLRIKRTIRMVTMLNRNDKSDRLHDVKVYGSTHNHPNNGVKKLCGTRTGKVPGKLFGKVVCRTKPWIIERYVIIQIPGNSEILTMCEVNVYVESKNMVEVAKNQPTYQSSTRGVGVSDNAVDGNKGQNHGTHGCTHTQTETNPWWSVDLGGVRTVRYVKIYNRGDCCGARLKNFKVIGGDDYNPNSGESQICVNKLTTTLSTGSVSTFYCSKPIDVAFLTIQLIGNKRILTLCEVEVYAN